MRQIASFLAIALLAAFALILSWPFDAGAAPQTYASDTFTRTLKGSWGSANIGGPYTLVGSPSYFAVNGNAGTDKNAANITQWAYLLNVSALNIDATFRVKTNKLASGGPQYVYFVARYGSGGNDYLGRISFPTDNSVRLVAFSELSGNATMLGTEAAAPKVTHVASKYVWLHMRVSGTNPTTILLRAWADGKPEPSNWAYSVYDSTSGLQAAGSVGFRSYLPSSTLNAPVVFSFDNLTVADAGFPTPTPTFSPTATGTPTPTPGNPNRHVYWGALVDGVAPSTQNMQQGGPFDSFEQDAQKRMSILHWGQPWVMNGSWQAFQPTWFDNVRAHGSIPMIDWASWELGKGPNQPNFQNQVIAGGTYDSFITQWATGAKNWGHPFFLRLDYEMNGWWYPWGEGQTSVGGPIVNGNSAGDFVKMWKHVHDIFQQVGATNVTWVWCINHESNSTQYPPLSQIYPGDAYADWTCLDGYNKYYPPTWLSFNSVLTGSGINWLINSYQAVLNVAPSKPMMMGETASLEYGDGGAAKAKWITDALTAQLIPNFPQINAFVWFNWDEGNPANTFPIESSSLAQGAFASGIGMPNYMVNQYSNLNTSPIPAP